MVGETRSDVKRPASVCASVPLRWVESRAAVKPAVGVEVLILMLTYLRVCRRSSGMANSFEGEPLG